MVNQNLLTWCDDLHQVKGNVSQFQATLNQIVQKAPSIAQFKQLASQLEDNVSDPGLKERFRSYLTLPQVKVAIRLKLLLERGYLPLLLALSRINFKSAKSDRYVGYFLDHLPPRQRIPDPLKKLTDQKRLPASYPPHLPPLSDDLLKLVLTDKSYRLLGDFVESQENGDLKFNRRHNARLALKGQKLLEFLVVDILETKFPNLHEDDLYHLSLRLTSKAVLAKLAYAYHLGDSLYHTVLDDAPVQDKVDVFARVFEAYIGALHQDEYLEPEIREWLDKLYEPIIFKANEISENGAQFKDEYQLAFAELNFLLKRIDNRYLGNATKKFVVETSEVESDPFVVHLRIDGEVYGVGTSSRSVEDAKNRAYHAVVSSPDATHRLLNYIFETYHVKDSVHVIREERKHFDEKEDDDVSDNYEPEVSLPPIPGDKPVPSLLPAPPPSLPAAPSKAPAAAPRVPLPYGSLPPNPNGGNNGVAPYSLPMAVDASLRGPVDVQAKTKLNSLLATKGLNAQYRTHKVGNDIQCTISVNDVVLGVAYDIHRKVAGNKAATNALNNKKVLEQLGITQG